MGWEPFCTLDGLKMYEMVQLVDKIGAVVENKIVVIVHLEVVQNFGLLLVPEAVHNLEVW